MSGISIIVCCYNSAKRISQTLDFLSKLKIPPLTPCEIIVVDNASSDNTRDVVQQQWAKSSNSDINLKIVSQPIPGLSFAKQKGMEEAAYDYFVFCDDDNLLEADYIGSAKKILDSYQEVGIIGGNNYYYGNVNNFVSQNYVGDFAVGIQAESEYDDITDERGFVWGAGMVVRRDVFYTLKEKGFQSLVSGRKGNKLLSGEDTELCFVARLCHWRIATSNLLVLHHAIPDSRFTLSYLTRMKEGFGQADPFLNIYRKAWEKKRNKETTYNYKQEVKTTFRRLVDFKKAILAYLTKQQQERKDYVELHYYLGKLQTLIKRGRELDTEFQNILQKYHV